MDQDSGRQHQSCGASVERRLHQGPGIQGQGPAELMRVTAQLLPGPALQPDTCHPPRQGWTQRSHAQASSKRLVIAFLRMTLASAGWQPSPVLLLRIKTAQNQEHDLQCYFSLVLSLQKQDRNARTPPPWILHLSQTLDSVTLGRSDILSFLITSTSFRHCYILLQSIRATDCSSRMSGNTASPTIPPLANMTINALIQYFHPLNFYS